MKFAVEHVGLAARDTVALKDWYARVLGARLDAGERLDYRLRPGRHGYLVPAKGAVSVNGIRVDKGDGAAIRDEGELHLVALDDCELVFVDCA